MLVIMALAVIVLMVAFVIPVFIDALSALNVEMPPLTMAVYNVSLFFTLNWQLITIIVLAVVLAIIIALKTERGKYFFDAVKVKLPFIGRITKDLLTARFARGFATLIQGGLDVISALQTVKGVLGNTYYEKRFNELINDVKKGVSLSDAITERKIFPRVISQMVAVGEKTGILDKVLFNSCKYFDDKAERALSTFTSVIQPIILLIVGAAVALMFLSVYTPLLQIIQTL